MEISWNFVSPKKWEPCNTIYNIEMWYPWKVTKILAASKLLFLTMKYQNTNVF